MIAVDWSHGKACSGSHVLGAGATSPLEADASRFWEQDPDYHEWLEAKEEQYDD